MNALSASSILTREEIQQVLADMHRRIRQGWHNGTESVNCRQNEIVFRLSCCCGLRASEICGLNIGDLTVTGPKPCIRLRRGIVKGKKRGRSVPLWWDKGTLAALTNWLRYRAQSQGASPDDPVVCGQVGAAFSKRHTRHHLKSRWQYALHCLGPDRIRQLSIHCGRHSFASHCLFAGRSMVEVQNAMGHASLSMTSRYAHLIERDNIPDIFGATE